MRELLILGAGGMLGTAAQQVARERGILATAYAESDLDITDERLVRTLLQAFVERLADMPFAGLVLNAAAYTDVERAEDQPERAALVNTEGARILAVATRDLKLPFVHVSTDFVFDGSKDSPYLEDDPPHPLNVYGHTKLEGELLVADRYPQALVVRTAWVYGPGGTNFPQKILDRARSAGALEVVEGEVGSPTYTVDLAAGILDLVDAGATGLYHLTGSGSCSRYQLAQETVRLAGLSVPVTPVAADAFPTKARRPKNSRLDCEKAAALGVRLPDWRDGLARYVTSL